MTQRPIGRVSTKLAACCLITLGVVSFGCTTTSEKEKAATETGSEFKQADQSEVEKEPVVETPVSEKVSLDLGTVYFDFDRSNIREDARPVLQSNAQQMERASSTQVRVEGFCDERGDEEYNLALGERRANSVKQYLENLGVSGTQMRTISYGEAKPAVQGHTEEAWKWNRRVEFHTND